MSKPKKRTIFLKGKKYETEATKGELAFWNYIKQGFTKKEAYIKAFPNSNPKYASIYAQRISKKEKFEPIKKSLWEQYKDDAQGAYDIQKQILRNEKIDPELRSKIADKIQDRAGFSPIVKTAQLRLNANVDNPLAKLSEKELIELSKETSKKLIELKREISKLRESREEVPMIEGEIVEE